MNQDPALVVSHIEPKKKWLDVDIKGLWRYRDLYRMYIKRDIVTVYKQTILGPIWLFIQPIFTTLVYMFVFGTIAGIGTDGVPQPLFYMAGVTMWNYFSACFGSCSGVFAANQGVFGKVYFPRLVVPLSSCTSNLIRYGIQLLMFICIYIYYVATGQFDVHLSWSVIFFPFLILLVGLHAMSWGLIITSFTTKYRDLGFLIGFGTQLLMYATPIIYPVSFAPEMYRPYLEINPLTPLFEAFKYSCLGAGTFSIGGIIYSIAFLCITLFVSIIIFNRTEQKFMDTV